jgi:hypothetical protein
LGTGVEVALNAPGSEVPWHGFPPVNSDGPVQWDDQGASLVTDSNELVDATATNADGQSGSSKIYLLRLHHYKRIFVRPMWGTDIGLDA